MLVIILTILSLDRVPVAVRVDTFGVLSAEAADVVGGVARPGAMLYPCDWLPDVELWRACVSGPGVSIHGACGALRMDRDGDGDCDLRDFVEGVR